MKTCSFAAAGIFATAVFVGVALAPSDASAVTITNGGFEDGLASIGTFTTLNAVDSTSITGWTVSAGSIDYIGTYWTASEGNRSIDLNGLSAGKIEQTISGLVIGQQYQISFDMAGNPDNGPATKTLDLMVDLSSNSFSFSVPSGVSHTNMGWLTQTFIFAATNTSETLSFASTTGGSPAAYGPALDNVSISVVPLPASLPLMLSGLAGFGIYLRRRRSQRVAT